MGDLKIKKIDPSQIAILPLKENLFRRQKANT